ncbi:hypothetical protein GMA12_00090 [Kocuria sediminis]|uniref:Phage tail tape measure protein domain-containing protein n=1 Tax=Kocuria sediminis TaxID=1038857 RepID=A0A6N8GFT5_9MICC|nr:phage tail tape measure protein [Kocuria sediminis]MUN61569.1 hypothetical protein [Kocuria sediminis]
MSSNDITFVARLRDHLTGPAKQAAKATEDLEKTSTRAGKHIAQAHDKAADAAEKGSEKTRRSLTKIERAFKALDGSAGLMGRALGESWDEAERGPRRALTALTGTGRQMVTESRQIGQRVGQNISSGIQAGIDGIDVSGLTTALGSVTVGGGVLGSLEQDRIARRVGAASGTDHEAIRHLAGDVYGAGLGADYGAVTDTAWSMIATLDIEPGSPEAAALLRGQQSIADAFQLPADRLSLATRVIVDGDGLTAAASQDVLTSALRASNPGTQDELLDALIEYGPVLRGTGVDMSVLASALSAASDQGPMAVDKTGDAFKEWAVRLASRDTTSSKAYAALGMDMGDLASRLQEGDAGALRDTASRLLEVEDAGERARLAIEAFGTPMEDLGPSQITDYLTAWSDMESGVLNTAGATNSLVDALTSGQGASATTMTRAIAAAFVDVGDALAPIITPAAKLVSLLAQPLAYGATALTTWGLIQRMPGGAAAAKWALSGLGTVIKNHPLVRLGLIAVGAVKGLEWLYENVGWVRDGFDSLGDGVRDVLGFFDDLGASIDRLIEEKFPRLHDAAEAALNFGDGRNTDGSGLSWADRVLGAGAFVGEQLSLPDVGGNRDDRLRMLLEDAPHHAEGGWTASGAHPAIVGEQGREFVVNHWASEKLAAVPGALGAIHQGKVPTTPIPVPMAAGAGSGAAAAPVVFNQNFTLGAGANADTAREFAAQWKREMAMYSRERRLTTNTLTARGAH